jgi:hypothetical protein
MAVPAGHRLWEKCLRFVVVNDTRYHCATRPYLLSEQFTLRLGALATPSVAYPPYLQLSLNDQMQRQTSLQVRVDPDAAVPPSLRRHQGSHAARCGSWSAEPPSSDQMRARYLTSRRGRLGHGPTQRRTVPGCQGPSRRRQVASTVGLANIHPLGHARRFAKHRRRGGRLLAADSVST